MSHREIETVKIQQALLIILCEDGPLYKGRGKEHSLSKMVQSDDVFRFLHYMRTNDALHAVGDVLGGLISAGHVTDRDDGFYVTKSGEELKVMVDEEVLFYEQTMERLHDAVDESIKQRWLSLRDATDLMIKLAEYAKANLE